VLGPLPAPIKEKRRRKGGHLVHPQIQTALRGEGEEKKKEGVTLSCHFLILLEKGGVGGILPSYSKALEGEKRGKKQRSYLVSYSSAALYEKKKGGKREIATDHQYLGLG